MKVMLCIFTLLCISAITVSCSDQNDSAQGIQAAEQKTESHSDDKHDHSSESKSKTEKHEDHKNESQSPSSNEKNHKEGNEKHAHKEGSDKQGKSKKGHGSHGGSGEHDEESKVTLTQKQRNEVNITTKQFNASHSSQATPFKITTTGEVQLNSYATVTIAPRIQVQILKRFVKKGDQVIKNQALILVSSVQMASAQGELLLTDQEWQRIKNLGNNIISKKRSIQTKIKRQLAFAKVQAYGMAIPEIKALLKKRDGTLASGQFTILSTIAGTVVNDDFIDGQVVESGKKLMSISNESVLWVVAHVTPLQLKNIRVGQTAKIVRNRLSLDAKVIQLPHIVNEKTRTVAVRLAINNEKDLLHAGEFVNVTLFAKRSSHTGSLLVPTEAVVKNSAGEWQIFIESKPNEFKPVDVKIIQNLDNKVQITGVNAGAKVVIKGTFFLQSELAKSGFSTHNH